MAIVRPAAPNLAELAIYRPVLDEFDCTFFYTGPAEARCRAELDALGLHALKLVRYRSQPDVLPLGVIQRAVDFKLGLGSLMLSGLSDALEHEIVNIVDPIYAFAGQLVGRLTPAQRLVIMRWEMITDRYEHIVLARRRAAAAFARADAVLCTSDAARLSLPATGLPLRDGAVVRTIRPGILLPATLDEAPASEARPRIVCIARLQWQKGIGDLLAAVQVLRDAADVQLEIIGGGDPRPWQRMAERIGIGPHVTFTGPLPNAAVRARLQGASVYCQPSLMSRTWCEQFGFAVAEAMAAGLPVVAYATGALGEVIGPDGLLVPARDIGALADALHQVVRAPSEGRRRGRALAARAREMLDAEIQGAALREVLRAL